MLKWKPSGGLSLPLLLVTSKVHLTDASESLSHRWVLSLSQVGKKQPWLVIRLALLALSHSQLDVGSVHMLLN